MNTSFERIKNGKDEWLTPPEIIKSLGKFDLDPCAPIVRPWSTAKKCFTILDDGLKKNWFGRVWLNPPYGNQTGKWLKKMVEHGNGIVLIFARTETKNFFEYIWSKADGIMFLKGRLRFYHVDGTRGSACGAPSCLVAFGRENAKKLKESGLNGKFLYLKKEND